MKQNRSRHFEIQPLAGGICAAIHKRGGWAISNAGILDLGDRVLVFDTFMTPEAARDLRKAAEALTHQSIALIVNSHYHNDHIWGNQVFDRESGLLSSKETLALIQTTGKQEIEFYSKIAETQLAELRTEMKSQAGGHQDPDLLNGLEYYEGTVSALPELSVREPELLFQDEMVIQGSEREVILKEFRKAHTGSDVVAYLPGDKILFFSDLLFIGCHPYFANGDPLQLRRVLCEILAYNADILVPGHGPVGSKADLTNMIEYIDRCFEAAGTIDDLPEQEITLERCPVPEPFEAWNFPEFYISNL